MLIYADHDPHYLQWLKALADFPGDMFIHTLEDEILYGDVDTETIARYAKVLRASQSFGDGLRYSYIRLIKSGCVELGSTCIADNLYEVPLGPANFSMQATIWWKPDYMAVMEAGQCKSVFDEPDYAEPANEMGIRGLYHYAGEKQRGRRHTDSFVFPHMATGINKGRFNSEYREEWEPLLKKYHLDSSKRGWL